MCGFGFRSSTLHSQPAYQASHGIYLDPEFSLTQKMLSEVVDNKLYTDFLDTVVYIQNGFLAV